MERARRRA